MWGFFYKYHDTAYFKSLYEGVPVGPRLRGDSLVMVVVSSCFECGCGGRVVALVVLVAVVGLRRRRRRGGGVDEVEEEEAGGRRGQGSSLVQHPPAERTV